MRVNAAGRCSQHNDNPTLERAGPVSVHGPNHARDGRSHKRQRRFLTPVLGIAGASRLDRIGRFDCLHTVTKVAVRETFPRRGHGISETLSKDSPWSQNIGTSKAWRPGPTTEGPNHDFPAMYLFASSSLIACA
jgi:hypothetical protein